ncbi:hypothetical protein [Arachidicoccus terrestris]|uniref:hypothetical protein n=1 Tax=Arachidicoccus terrestris TaxID=2875539 RepID=UPI001CC6B7EC|nr:hypothetical protein [Arachidicoccus terrestris]UAY56543.1 hypothetical protein K9M52_05940 [Arachidicoccus terrestris]
MRRLKELAAMLNKQIGSFPDNILGITQADIDQQIYTATGLAVEDFLAFDEKQLEDTIAKYGEQGGPLMLDFLGNLFYYQYQVTGDNLFLTKARDFYARFQQETGTFSMVYFQRMQQH